MTRSTALESPQVETNDESIFLHYVLPFEENANRTKSGDLKASQTLLDEHFGTPKLAQDKNYTRTLLFTKLASEHPISPVDAATRATGSIQNLGANQRGYAEASSWLNDGNSGFREQAAREFNTLQITVFKEDSNELCLLQATKKNGALAITESLIVD